MCRGLLTPPSSHLFHTYEPLTGVKISSEGDTSDCRVVAEAEDGYVASLMQMVVREESHGEEFDVALGHLVVPAPGLRIVGGESTVAL